jgi:hypothetical protein
MRADKGLAIEGEDAHAQASVMLHVIRVPD